MRKVAIGIDLGTTYSCVGVWRNNNVEIVANENGNRTTPSYVSYGNDILVGEAAKNQAIRNPTNTIFDAKRLIGRSYTDVITRDDTSKHWPFKIVNKDGEPMFHIQDTLITPEEIASKILMKLKKYASDLLNTEVTDAVITVPAYFSDVQRQATKDAGTIAGLNVLRILNEPTAASMAYGLDMIKSGEEKKILVYDFGGGTLDCTILTISGGIFEVKATSGNSRLGGEDIDSVLINYCIQHYKEADLYNVPSAIGKLRIACEKAKRELSVSNTTTISIDALHEGNDFTLDLTRARFEILCNDIFKKAMRPLEQVLQDSKLQKYEIDEIVLVGGSTRIPKIKRMISDLFDGKELNESVNPDEAVAYGATVQAAILSGAKSEIIDGIVLLDVTPLSLGVETAGGAMSVVIPRNTSIPTKKSQLYTTYLGNQREITIDVFEGERMFTRDNNKLGSFKLNGITPVNGGKPHIIVYFAIDSNGILNVTALDKGTNKTNNLTVTGRNKLSTDQINQMISDAKKYEDEDTKKHELMDARYKLDTYVTQIRKSLGEPNISMAVNDNTRKEVEDKCASVFKWLDENEEATLDAYKNLLNEVEELWNPIMAEIFAKMTKEQIVCDDDDSVSSDPSDD